ncbi:hypothetical protein BDR26DRAFT_189064 [Obelidium mucronatum]|nr:hypothetical protein BDR26DRAFT_189064 [Obelidium mucronatum]
MDFRLGQGLADYLMEEWKEILQLCKADASRKLILLKVSGDYEFNQFEWRPEITDLVDALESVSGVPPICACIPRAKLLGRPVHYDVMPEILACHFGKIDTLILLSTLHFSRLTSKSKEDSIVTRTAQDVVGWLKSTIIPHLEAEIAATNTSGIKTPEELATLKRQYATSAYQLAFFLSSDPNEKEIHGKYLKIAADNNHRYSQFYFAKKMESMDPALSHFYYKKACEGGHLNAAFRLGQLWESGDVIVGGKVSLEKAIEYYQHAEKIGHSEAQKRVTECLKKRKVGRSTIEQYTNESPYYFAELSQQVQYVARADDGGDDFDENDEGADADNSRLRSIRESSQASREQSIQYIAQALNQVTRPYCASGAFPVTNEAPFKLIFQKDTNLANTQSESSNRDFQMLSFPLTDGNTIDSFLTGCPYEISPVISGTRVTLTYHLLKRDAAREVFESAEKILPRDRSFLSQLRNGLSDASFFSDGAILMVHGCHAYGISDALRKSDSALLPLLKGADLDVFKASVACGLKVFVKPLYFESKEGTGGPFFLGASFKHYCERHWSYPTGTKFLQSTELVHIDDKKAVWYGKPLILERHAFLCGRGSVGSVYSSVAIVVVVPAWKDRSA